MECTVEAGNGDQLNATITISPEERRILQADVAYFQKICEDTKDVAAEKRLLLFNKENRHLRLEKILNIVKMLITDPEDLRQNRLACTHEGTMVVQDGHPFCTNCSKVW